jgi:putative spermidine/putrescine transport system ATP-binding protein
LLDEPLSALDESLRVKTRGELRKLQRQFGMTFIQVTHNQDEAYALSDQIVVMDHGRIDQVGTPQEIFSQTPVPVCGQLYRRQQHFPRALSLVHRGRCQWGGPDSAGGAWVLVAIALSVAEFAQVGTASLPAVCGADHLHLSRLYETALQVRRCLLPISLTGRITAVEFTGYITRVSLALEQTGVPKCSTKSAPPTGCSSPFRKGQVVCLELGR